MFFKGICYRIDQTGSTGSFSPINGQARFTSVPEYKLRDNSINLVPKRALQSIDTKFKHLVVMGNSLGVSRDESLVFGAPYAWVGTTWSGKFSKERRVGTIAKFQTKTQNIKVPNPMETNGFGASWLYDTTRLQASEINPLRHDLTGTSFVKGKLSIIPI